MNRPVQPHKDFMKSTRHSIRTLAFMALGLVAAQAASAAIIWNGPGAGNNNWSVSGNWLGGIPGAGDDVQFFDAGGAGLAVSNINNVVDAGFTSSIQTLQYGNTNGNHTTLINPGQTLTVTGSGTNGIIVGTEADNGNTELVTATITGPGGTLSMNNTGENLIVRQGANLTTGARATLNLSGLDNFTATIAKLGVGLGVGSPANRYSGILYLARTNTITLGGSSSNPGLVVGDSAGAGNTGIGCFLYLGQTNVIFADNVAVARVKQNSSSMLFNPVFTANNGNPVAYFRGADGVSRVATWSIADGTGNSGTQVTPTGTNDFTGGTVDALVDAMVLGKTSTVSPTTRTAAGTLTFSAGIIDVNTLQAGFLGNAASNDVAIGTVNVNGTAKLIVNTSLELGHVASGGTNFSTRGLLNLNGGRVNANRIICGIGTNTIALTNGTLNVTNTIGAVGVAIRNFNVTNSTLGLAAQVGGVASAVVTNLTTGGTNIINIVSIPVLAGYPAQFTLIKYSGTISGAGFNFGRGTLPPSTGNPYAGYISNNTANSSVDLVLTDGAPPAKSLTWKGTPSGDWDVGGTLNWALTNGTATTYNQADFITFNDTASGVTTVNMTTGMAPTGLTVSNNSKLYTLSGDHITGTTALNKQGSGTLILDNGGNNDFTGGVIISGGTLQVGNAGINGNLPTTGAVTDNGSLIFNVGVDVAVPNAISGAGAVTYNGGQNLTLSGANSFTGTTTVASGSTLRVGNNSALGATNGPTIISPGATLDVSQATANSINLGLEEIRVSGAGVGNQGAIVNSSAVGSFDQRNATRVVTLLGDTTLAAPQRWDIRAVPTTNPAGAALNTGGQPYKLTKIGANFLALVGVTVDPALDDIDVKEGVFSVETVTTGLGNPAKTLTIESGATLQFFNMTNLLNKNIVLNGDGSANTVSVTSGANTVVGPMALIGPCIFNAGGTSLTLSNTMTGSGSLTKNGTGLLVIAGTASYTGGTIVNVNTLAVNGTLAGPLTTIGGTTLTGTGTSTGLADVSGLLNPGTANGAGTLTTSGGLTLEGGATLTFDLSPTNTANGGLNDLLTVSGPFNVNGNTITINLLQPQVKLQTGTYRLINYSGSLSGSFDTTVTTVSPSRYGLTLNTATPHQVNLIVTGSPADLRWSSTSSSSWDTGNSLNWQNLAGLATTNFLVADTVLFDDTASVVTNVTLDAGAVLPSTVTNNSSINNFILSGAGKISGSASIVKQGTSTLTLATTNDFTGPISVLAGVLKVGCTTNALGATNGATTIASGAALDIGNNTNNVGLEPIIISGSGVGGGGAIINSSGSGTFVGPNFAIVTLAGDTTIGGPGRLDLRSNPSTTNFASLSTTGHPYKLTKVSTNQFQVTGVVVDPALGDIEVQGGIFGVQGFTTLGNASSNLTVFPNATLQFFNVSNVMNKVLVLNNGATVNNNSGANTFGGPVTLQGSNTFSVGGTTLNVTSVISGTGSLVKTGTNQLILSAANTYSGSTLVNMGTLSLSGAAGSIAASPTIIVAAGATLDATLRPDATLTLINGQTLYGNGNENGTLVVNPGANVSPGAAANTVGILTVAGSATLSGTTRMEIDKGHTNDLFRSTAGTLTYGGTLNVTNINTTNAFAIGDSFQLFSALNYAGGFTSIVPATPGAGLAWDTSALLTTGTLKVVTSVVNPPHIVGVTVTGSSLVFSGTGGTAGNGFSVYSSTDVSLPLTSWTLAGSGVFDGSGNFSVTNSVNPATPSRFFILRVP
jgi:fibronectin-binding autotransporter adhesin